MVGRETGASGPGAGQASPGGDGSPPHGAPPPGEHAAPPPGEHGDDLAGVAAWLGVDPGAVLDLAATVNPVAPDPRPVVAGAVDAVARYPDEGRAVAALAETLGVGPERLVLTNGGAEAIALVAAEQPVGWVDEPDFSLYRRHLERVVPGAPRWASNPHNPTGRLAAAHERAAVWDEAHYVLATGTWTRADRGAVVVGSLTKALACPGLRVGYVVAPDAALARRVRARRPRWSVNALAAEALPGLLARADPVAWARGIAVLRDQLVGVLRSHGLEPLPSDAPWLLVPGAPGLRERLARELVLVRDCTSFGLPDHTRVAVPDERGLERLDAALARTH